MGAWSASYVEEELTYSIIGSAYDVYNELRFGFREHVYVMALERLLIARGHRVGREVSVPVFFQGVELTSDRLDMIVDDQVVVEVRSTSRLTADASRQLFSDLRGTNLEVGLLLHFGPKGLGRFRLIASNELKSRIRSNLSADSASSPQNTTAALRNLRDLPIPRESALGLGLYGLRLRTMGTSAHQACRVARWKPRPHAADRVAYRSR
jgi:GxxExxY protein